MLEKDLELNLETKNKPVLRDITIKIRYFPDGFLPDMIIKCDFCGEDIESDFGKKIHFQLCQRCKELFNKKINEGSSIVQNWGSIGLFRK